MIKILRLIRWKLFTTIFPDKVWLYRRKPLGRGCICNPRFLKPVFRFAKRKSFTSSAPGGKWWYATLISSLEGFLDESKPCILDFGGGNGALGNYISGFYTSFNYYCLEPAGSTAILDYIVDDRFQYGQFLSDVEVAAISSAQGAVLGSVFTHLDLRSCLEILERLLPIAKRGGCISFTCFLADEERYLGLNHYKYSSIPTYHYSFLPFSAFKDFALSNSLKAEVLPYFYSLGDRKLGDGETSEVVHNVVRIFSAV